MTAATASFSTGLEPSPGQTHRLQTSFTQDLLVKDSPPSPTLHSHRQSHNSSKLPAFRFADLNKTTPATGSSAALSHPSLAHHNVGDQPEAQAPPSGAAPGAVSPNTVAPGGPPSADPGPVTVTDSPDPVTTSENPQSTTHRQSEQQLAVSTSASAPTSASASASASTAGYRVTTASTAPTTASTAPSTASASITSPPPPPQRPSRSRASSLQPSPSPTAGHHSTPLQRTTSFPDAQPAGDVVAQSPHPTSSVVRSRTRRSLVSRRSNAAAAASTGPPPSLSAERLQAVEAAEVAQSTQSSAERSTKDSPQGQRELILPKTLSNSSPPDERRTSGSHRPPVSFRPPLSNSSPVTSTPVRVPPIRGFRSSGSRKSLTLDMNSRPRFYDVGDDLSDSNHDHTLRALEGRADQDYMQTTPLSSRHDALDGDDTGDVFLKIAREEQNRRLEDESFPDESHSIVSRVMRSSHRRPLSSTVPTYTPTSPPRIPRRLSDQQESSRGSRKYDDDRASEVVRFSNYRSLSRDKAASVHPAEELGRLRTNLTTSRTGPLTPRSMVFQETEGGNSAYARRRSSITDSNFTAHVRNSGYKPVGFGHTQNKSYNSSPLVKSFDFPRTQGTEGGHAREGTESTTSNTAPSTVWDELDDLKSRINRLELTGKMPSTSGAAMSRLSDERPPTATTAATTVSTSPKRQVAGAQVQTQPQPTDATSTTSAHREAHPILHSALAKSKPLLDAEVYRALESAANDAMGLASMMGAPGLPGPISSGASTIGSGTTITDRQLRRKADSVCRSLTELCLALGEESASSRTTTTQVVQTYATSSSEAPTTPTINKSFTPVVNQRRPSVATEQNLPRSNTSPRALSKFEERRISILTGSGLPSPRVVNSTPSTPLESQPQAQPNRRSSLMVPRSRRATTEEPDEGRKSSLLLRSRRAGTEEPEEGRKTSLLVRSRRNTVGEDDDESRFQAPSRAQTELHNVNQALQPAASDASSLATSALPRRRFVSSSLHTSRLATPVASTATPSRKYFERSTPDRDGNSVVDKLAEDRGHRPTSLAPTSLLSRHSSVSRRTHRDSTIPTLPASSTAGGYR